MKNIAFTDLVHQTINFNGQIPEEKLIIDLIDTKWVQRLRQINQTANTRYVYMFSEHSRFGHSLGVCYLAKFVLDKLEVKYTQKVKKYKAAILAAALLHDIGHLAPGSHLAQKVWFPNCLDQHEEIGHFIIKNDAHLAEILNSYDKDLLNTISDILSESDNLPAWTWQLISGGGWNVDRGNWCIVDSKLSGVSYGIYNINALTDSIDITLKGHLAIKENRLDAMMHFAVSRHAMYKQVYQHRVILSADCLQKNITKRIKNLNNKEGLFFDETMKKVLSANSFHSLNLDDLFNMTESWWEFHLSKWKNSKDLILRDLSLRLLNRKFFKTIKVDPNNFNEVKNKLIQICEKLNFNPDYYFNTLLESQVHKGDSKQSMLVILENGDIKNISDIEPLYSTLVDETHNQKMWFAVPAEVKASFSQKA